MSRNPFPTIYQDNDFKKKFLNINETTVTWHKNYTIKVLVEDTSVYPKT